MKIAEKIKDVTEDMIAFRRLLHQNPELSHQEVMTSQRICQQLEAHGIEYQANVGGHGVVAIVRGAQAGKTVALRADMDALPVTEENDLPYRSQIDGVMHACGHDVHTAIMMASGWVLQSMRHELTGNVKFFFQGGEEDEGGAADMIAQGCLENPAVSHVVGLHVQPDVPAGMVELKRGKLNGNCGDVNITIHGEQGHACTPHIAVDAVVIAAHVVTALQTLVSRNTSPVDSAVLTFGSLHSGEKGNIISRKAVLAGTLRTLDKESRSRAESLIVRIATHTAQALGGRAEVSFENGYIALINDDTVMDTVEAAAREILPPTCITYKEAPSLGGEDFSFFADAVPSAFFHLGCGQGEDSAPLHSHLFVVDEACMALGVELEVNTVLRLLEQ